MYQSPESTYFIQRKKILMSRMFYYFLSLWLFLVNPSQAKLTIGVTFFDPPFVYSSDQGFNIDLAQAICKGMNQECVIRPMLWNKLFLAVDKGDIDVLMGAYITPERAKKYQFTIPYMLSQGCFVTLTSNHLDFIQQLHGLKIGIVQEEKNSGVFHNFVDFHYPGLFKLVDYKDLPSLLKALSQKSISAAVVHNHAVDYWVNSSNGLLTTVGPIFNIGEGIGLLTLPRNVTLITQMNKQLIRLQNNGDYLKIYNKYF